MISEWEWSSALAGDLAHEIFEAFISSELLAKNFPKPSDKDGLGV